MNYHQGDILLRRIDKIPNTAKKTRDEIVAYGEVTGHAHRVKNAEIFEDGKETFVRIPESEPMTHDTHPPTLPIETGDYERLRQYEYFPEGDLEVKD